MNAIAIVGMPLGTMGFILSVAALARINKLEKHLKEISILDREYEHDG